jgi:hypothetical protein
MPRKTLTDTQVLRKAAAIIEERGHAKGKLFDSKGRVCLAGAINSAISGKPSYFGTAGRTIDLLERVGRYLARKTKKERLRDFSEVVLWNDRARTTAAQVVEALRKS